MLNEMTRNFGWSFVGVGGNNVGYGSVQQFGSYLMRIKRQIENHCNNKETETHYSLQTDF